jgi:hypothetical protein
MTHWRRLIEKLEAKCSMLYEVVLGLTRSSWSLASHPKILIGFAPTIVKDEEIVQQEQGYWEMDNVDLELQL